MPFKLNQELENYLLHQPETGMGYQIINAKRDKKYFTEKFLILNSEVVIEMNSSRIVINENINKVIKEGISMFKFRANIISLNSISVLNEKQLKNIVGEPKNENERGAIENPIIHATGDEIFIRLSAFEKDRRIDKIKKCLLAGTYTTTMEDYLNCKNTIADPIERYALPSNVIIKYAFHIQPLKSDTLQTGIVQPANEKRGGGKETYFAKGTAEGTFQKQTTY